VGSVQSSDQYSRRMHCRCAPYRFLPGHVKTIRTIVYRGITRQDNCRTISLNTNFASAAGGLQHWQNRPLKQTGFLGSYRARQSGLTHWIHPLITGRLLNPRGIASVTGKRAHAVSHKWQAGDSSFWPNCPLPWLNPARMRFRWPRRGRPRPDGGAPPATARSAAVRNARRPRHRGRA